MPAGDEWPPAGSPLAPTPEMEQLMKRMNYPLVKVRRKDAHMAERERVDAGADYAVLLMLSGAMQQCDMIQEMRDESVDIIVGGIEKYSKNMEEACKLIKEMMDLKFGGPWHVRCPRITSQRCSFPARCRRR